MKNKNKCDTPFCRGVAEIRVCGTNKCAKCWDKYCEGEKSGIN